MPNHDRQQVFPAFCLYPVILGYYHHTIRHFRSAGIHQVAPTLDLDHTDATAFSRLPREIILDFLFTVKNGLDSGPVFGGRQVRMITQTGDIDICFAGCLQNGRSGRNLNRLSIDGHAYRVHIPLSNEFKRQFLDARFQ
jgi:hypothetical protein